MKAIRKFRFSEEYREGIRDRAVERLRDRLVEEARKRDRFERAREMEMVWEEGREVSIVSGGDSE